MTKQIKRIQINKLIGTKEDTGFIQIDYKLQCLYALSIGFNTDPLNKDDYKYTFQKWPGFCTFPTITSVMNLNKHISLLKTCNLLPQYELHQLLHAQQKLYLVHNQIKLNTKYRQESQIIDAVDKGKNAFFYLRQSAYIKNEKGIEELAYYVDRTIFIRGLGGFGFKGNNSSANIPDVPKTNPDIILKDRTFPNQAFFYRLCNDGNPLHIDPAISSQAGFQRPIIHGMASYGVVTRCIVQNLLGNNPEKIKSLQVRLIGHVFPGESFEIKIWRIGNKLHFVTEVVQRKRKALLGVLTIRQQAKI